MLGIRDGQTDNGNGNGTTSRSLQLENNYGPLAYDHTQILNLSAVWNMPKPIHGNRVLEGAVNGWQLSAYTTYQSGAPLQQRRDGSLNAVMPVASRFRLSGAPNLPNNAIHMPNGLICDQREPFSWLGTNAYQRVGRWPAPAAGHMRSAQPRLRSVLQSKLLCSSGLRSAREP